MDISECKMGSIIYTYQRSKRKPIPLTEERIQTLRDHEKFLKRHRVGEYRSVAQSGSVSGLGPEGRKFESCHSDQKPTMRGKSTKPVIDWKKEESQNFTVAPAYNKGAYQVITKSNIKDIGR